MGSPSGTVGTTIALSDLLLPHACTYTQTCMTHRDISRRYLVYAKALAGRISGDFFLSFLATLCTHLCISVASILSD